jgi:hypothetical protein
MTAGLTPGELRQFEALSRKLAGATTINTNEDIHS